MATKFVLACLRSESMGRGFVQHIQIQGLAICLAPPPQQSLTSPPASSRVLKDGKCFSKGFKMVKCSCATSYDSFPIQHRIVAATAVEVNFLQHRQGCRGMDVRDGNRQAMS